MKKVAFYTIVLLCTVFISCGNKESPQPEIQKDYFEFKLDGTIYSFEFPTEEILGSYTNHPSGEAYTILAFNDNPVDKIVAHIGTTEKSIGSYDIESPDNGETVTAITITLFNDGIPLLLESQSGTLTLNENTRHKSSISSGGYVDAEGSFYGTFVDDEGNTHNISEGRFRSKESNLN